MTPVRLEPATLRSRVKHSTTEPLRSREMILIATVISEDSDETAHPRTLVRAIAAYTDNVILEGHINFGLKSGSLAPSIC